MAGLKDPAGQDTQAETEVVLMLHAIILPTVTRP